MTGTLPRACSGTNSRPSAFGVSLICSLLAKSNSVSVTDVFSSVRLPAPSSTILTGCSGAVEQAAIRRHDRIRRKHARIPEMREMPLVAVFQPDPHQIRPDAPRAEQVRHVDRRIRPTLVTGPQRRVSPVTGRTNWEWQYQQPSRRYTSRPRCCSGYSPWRSSSSI